MNKLSLEKKEEGDHQPWYILELDFTGTIIGQLFKLQYQEYSGLPRARVGPRKKKILGTHDQSHHQHAWWTVAAATAATATPLACGAQAEVPLGWGP